MATLPRPNMLKKLLPLTLILALGAPVLPLMPAQAAVAMDFSALVEQVSSGVVRINTMKPVRDGEFAMAHKAMILKQFFVN